MRQLAGRILRHLERGERLVRATVLAQTGSTPRTAGADMLILADGCIEGTIGGGLVEAEVMKKGTEMIGSPSSRICSYDLGLGQRADSMDMLCGGRLDVLLEPLAPDADAVEFYRRVVASLTRGSRALVITPLPGSETSAAAPPKYLMEENAAITGTPAAPEGLPNSILTAAFKRRHSMVYPQDDPQFLIEPLAAPGTVYIFGAGHVSQAVATLTAMVGFRTVVRDDRPEFANRRRFPTADLVETISSFDNALSGLELDTDSYIVIVTRGHRHDGTVLALALASGAGYIGMIGSRRKRESIYRDLLARGVGSRDLDRVHSPIGLAIGADSPEEIAVSIVGELIAVRAEKSS